MLAILDSDEQGDAEGVGANIRFAQPDLPAMQELPTTEGLPTTQGRTLCSPLQEVPGWFEDWEQRLSRFRKSSELSELNRQSGRLVQVSGVLWEVLQVASEAVQWSNSLVLPTLLGSLEAAGYDRSFESLDPLKASRQQEDYRQGLKDWRAIEWHAHSRSLCLPSGVRLDLGGVAKGWAADEAARRMGMHGPSMIDAGGDIAVSGLMADGQRWPVGVEDPSAPDRSLELLMLDKGGLATSGRDYRRWQTDGKWQHHIIDPRTGRPADTDVLSATIIAPTACQAEVAAKVALILGSREGSDWLESRPNMAGLLVLEDGKVMRSSRLKNYLWS